MRWNWMLAALGATDPDGWLLLEELWRLEYLRAGEEPAPNETDRAHPDYVRNAWLVRYPGLLVY